jgi:hypothetical protein
MTIRWPAHSCSQIVTAFVKTPLNDGTFPMASAEGVSPTNFERLREIKDLSAPSPENRGCLTARSHFKDALVPTPTPPRRISALVRTF